MSLLRRTVAAGAVLALALTACGGDDADDATTTTPAATDAPAGAGDGSVPEGPTINVGSFNFAESQILANIYALALADAGYPISTQLDLGSREVIFPELEDGSLSFLPEYVGSALSVGFGGEPTGDLEATLAELTARFEEIGVTVLEPAPGQDANVFAVTGAFAQEFGLATLGDLARVDRDVVVAGAPECETRLTCLLALTEVYGLENVTFESIQEGGLRVSSLKQGAVDVAALFSTQPVIAVEGFVVLEDPEGAIPVENIVPVVADEVVEAYGDAFTALVDGISARITTELLIELNGRVELDAEDPEDVAREWLEAEGLLG